MAIRTKRTDPASQHSGIASEESRTFTLPVTIGDPSNDMPADVPAETIDSMESEVPMETDTPTVEWPEEPMEMTEGSETAADSPDVWADVLHAAVIPAFTRARVDVEQAIPESIRNVLEVSLTSYYTEVSIPTDSGVTVSKEGEPVFREFEAGSQDRATEFIKFARTWARNRRNNEEPNDGRVIVRINRATQGSNKSKTNRVRFAVIPVTKDFNSSSPKTARNADTAKVRAWARDNGISVSERGRISADIVKAYNAAGGNAIDAVNTGAVSTETAPET